MKYPIRSIREYLNRNIIKPLFTSAVILILAVVILVVIDLIFKPGGTSYWDNIFAELHGMLFDVAIILFLFNWIESKREKKLRIERYKEEIEDYRPWQGEEATWRICGLIRRLNKLNKTFFQLTGAYLREADLSRAHFENSLLTGANLENAILLDAHLENVHLEYAQLNGAILAATHFEGAFLQNAKLALYQLKRSIFSYSTTMMDGTLYDESWAERINQAWEAHEREGGTRSEP